MALRHTLGDVRDNCKAVIIHSTASQHLKHHSAAMASVHHGHDHCNTSAYDLRENRPNEEKTLQLITKATSEHTTRAAMTGRRWSETSTSPTHDNAPELRHSRAPERGNTGRGFFKAPAPYEKAITLTRSRISLR